MFLFLFHISGPFTDFLLSEGFCHAIVPAVVVHLCFMVSKYDVSSRFPLVLLMWCDGPEGDLIK